MAYELLNRLQDNYGNSYPPEDNIHLTCNETGNSNGILTKDILEKVIFPFINVEEGNRGGVLVDDYKGHSTDVVKEYVKSYKNGNDSDYEED